MSDVLTTISTRKTPQDEKADKRQVLNSAGGYVFALEPLAQARRFLILGTDGGTYYTSAKDLTVENAQVILSLAETDHTALVDLIVEVSKGGLAPKVNPAIFALAICSSVGTADEKRYALSKLSDVCRTGTHLFTFAKYVEQFRGWGRGLRTAVANWYLDKPVDRLAYQAIKYRQRDGWTHRDLLRLSHPEVEGDERKRELFHWIVKGEGSGGSPLVKAYKAAQDEGADVPTLVKEHRLPWEALPTESLNKAETWEALFEAGIPQGALLRQLPRLTNLGLLPDMGGITNKVTAQLTDPERLKSARVHPVSVLIALRTYASGKGRGSSWTPSRKVIDALDEAFYAAYGAVEPMNKRTMIGLDVSGSMGSPISGLPITAREASAAICLVTAAVEPDHVIYGFTGGGGGGYGWGRRENTVLTKLNISKRQRLDDVCRSVAGLRFGATDCSLPMRGALQDGLEVETFIILTDNETWYGDVHPHQALREYREKTDIAARLIVVGMTSTGFSIADPSDPLSLDVVGMDASVPNLISDFGAGR